MALTKADITAANAAPWLQKVLYQNTTSRQFVMNPPKAKNALTNPRQRNVVQKKKERTSNFLSFNAALTTKIDSSNPKAFVLSFDAFHHARGDVSGSVSAIVASFNCISARRPRDCILFVWSASSAGLRMCGASRNTAVYVQLRVERRTRERQRPYSPKSMSFAHSLRSAPSYGGSQSLLKIPSALKD